MGYQFDCVRCGKKIEVPEGTQGRQAKCPFCAALMVIPGAVPPLAETTSAANSAAKGIGIPDGIGAAAKSDPAVPFSPRAESTSTTSPDPYRTFYGHERRLEAPAGRSPALTTAAIIMTVYGILGVVAVAIQIAFVLSPAGQSQIQQEITRQAAGAQVPPERLETVVKLFLSVVAAAALAAAVLSLLGGVQIIRRRTWTFSMICAIACLMPTHCCLCLINFPLAVTTIILLTSNKKEFS